MLVGLQQSGRCRSLSDVALQSLAKGAFYADLHLHSRASDGTWAPGEVVAQAKARDFGCISLTDHDTTAGIKEAVGAGWENNVLVIPGVELSCEMEAAEVHVLGYFIDVDSHDLHGYLERFRTARESRARQMVKNLNKLGIKLHFDEVAERARGESVGRPHIAAALVGSGYASTIQEAFHRYLHRRSPAYVSRYKLKVPEAAELIRAAGGVPILAHPGLVGNDSLVRGLIDQGMAGVEAYHSEHTPSQVRKYLSLAEELGILVTGGSDCHGPGGKDSVLMGKVRLPGEEVLRLFAAKGISVEDYVSCG